MSDAKSVYGGKNREPLRRRGRRLEPMGARSDGPRRTKQGRRGAGVRPAAGLLLRGLALFAFLGFFGQARAASFQEYQLKAIFLYNFVNFVTWPDEAFDAPDSPFVIGVLGKDPFGSFLEKVVADETFKGRPIRLKRGDFPDELADCRILFIGASNRSRIRSILRSVSPRHVLTVGDFDGFIEAGGMINLPQVGQRVGIEIDVRSTRNAGLGVSSKLLRVAKIISD